MRGQRGFRRTIPRGSWWAFEDYVLTEGGIIRPAPGAKLRIYDPWEKYEVGRQRRGGDREPPYQALVRLARRVRAPGGQWKHDRQLTEEVLGFCREYGLLGILSDACAAAWLWPIWARAQPLPPLIVGDVLWIEQTEYLRVGGGWVKNVRRAFPTSSVAWETSRLGQPVERGFWPRGIREPGVLLHWGPISEWREAPFRAWWTRFFPDLDWDPLEEPSEGDLFAYPLPLSEEFWHVYGEPISEFMDAALSLTWLLEAFKALRDVKGADSPSLAEVLEVLNRRVGPIAPGIYSADGSMTLGWKSHSLLGYFSLMMVMDIVGGRTLRQCEICDIFFTSRAYQARYCSQQCRWRAQKRRQRGKTIPQIEGRV